METSQEIPKVNLKIQIPKTTKQYSESILENEIKGIYIEYVVITDENARVDTAKEGCTAIYLFLKGKGKVIAADISYDIIPETIFLPNIVKSITIKTAKKDTLHYLKISNKLTEQDYIDLKEFPSKNTQQVYCAKFKDCQSYSEPIKSPNTISRTILPNKIIPRIAMGTVQTKGPDKVGAHEHPMLEQLFLGLSKNNCIVYADDAKTVFSQYDILHIPLGSTHSVSVENKEVMYYIWMDFFLDKKGEEWLKTHIVDSVTR